MQNMIWTSEQIGQALFLNLETNDNFGKIQFNSKDIEKGDIFIALKDGARDGHEFVLDAFIRGAGLAIVSQDIKNAPVNKLIKVEDTFEALQSLAEYKRQNSKAHFIGVTGSVGKTSTKEIIGLMLNSFGKTFISRGNFNNHIGVPINLASVADDKEFVVIEMGMRKAGEISLLTKQVKPGIAIITSVAPVHLEFFACIKKITDAKSEIFDGVDINTGIAILNRDISTYKRCIENIDRAGIKNIKTFGKSQFANIRLVSYSLVGQNMVKLTYNIFHDKIEFVMPVVPKHMAVNFAAALAAIYCLGLNINEAVKALPQFKLRIGRGRIVDVKKEDKNYSIMTDYYNASPDSMKASLAYLHQFKNSKKSAVLGDMKELGNEELKFHSSLLPHIVKSGINKLFLVGNVMPEIAKEIPETILVYTYKTSEELAFNINKYIDNEEIILIKGSRSIHLEKVAEALGVTNAL